MKPALIGCSHLLLGIEIGKRLAQVGGSLGEGKVLSTCSVRHVQYSVRPKASSVAFDQEAVRSLGALTETIRLPLSTNPGGRSRLKN